MNLQSLAAEIYIIHIDCRDPGWDGYDADPIKDSSRDAAIKVLKLLPKSLPLPEAAPEIDGKMSLEWWHVEKGFMFAIEVDADYLDTWVCWAGDMGATKVSGKEKFERELPEKLLKDLKYFEVAYGRRYE